MYILQFYLFIYSIQHINSSLLIRLQVRKVVFFCQNFTMAMFLGLLCFDQIISTDSLKNTQTLVYYFHYFDFVSSCLFFRLICTSHITTSHFLPPLNIYSQKMFFLYISLHLPLHHDLLYSSYSHTFSLSHLLTYMQEIKN